MSAEKFMKLVEDYRGVEFVHAYRGDVDHYIGGKGKTFWYVIAKKGRIKESYIATFEGGSWNDRLLIGDGATKKEKALASGSTIQKIVEKAYFAQEENWVQRSLSKAKVIEDNHPHYHFVYGFGDKAADVSAEFGVTIAYSDLKDEAAGFHLRDISTGDDVEEP